MRNNVEILAPGGDIDSIKAAIIAGANAIYCGLNKFNARNRAENITFDDLNGILHLAHKHDCQVFLTLNISIVESEWPDLTRLLNRLVNTSIDAIIVQDMGLFYLVSKYFPSLNVHASTQLTTHNKGQLKFLKKLAATRVNLSRELNANEIRSLTQEAHHQGLLNEVFVHGSYCISYSGVCYMSSFQSGNSGNRGRCSQPCRDEYETTSQGHKFPLNLKDNSAWFNLPELYSAGVDSLKIEGRIKKYHYVYSVVKAYNEQLLAVSTQKQILQNDGALYGVFNRDFSNGFLQGEIGSDMFIDNPRDYSSTHLALKNGGASKENIDAAEKQIYSEKGQLRTKIKEQIDQLNALQIPLKITVSGNAGQPLVVEIHSADKQFTFSSEQNLGSKGAMPIDVKMLMKRFKAINETEYFIEDINLDHLDETVFIPFKELTLIKDNILFQLRNSREVIQPINLPKIDFQKDIVKPVLSVLINDEKDIHLTRKEQTVLYFQLPNDLKTNTQNWIDFFIENNQLIPWFPSILIDEDYVAALEFLKQVKPKRIVTNNTGIAFAAVELGISWIAGPYLNTTNSYSLACLKEKFNCDGAFISNELKKQQINGIKKPSDFEMHFSIYHPLVLMSSRQCFFLTTTGCEKTKMDQHCMQGCKKQTTLKNLKSDRFIINKSKGNYNTIYNDTNYLNTEIVADFPNRFSSFMIDLCSIKTATKAVLSKEKIVAHFEGFLDGYEGSQEKILESIKNTNNKQYYKGI